MKYLGDYTIGKTIICRFPTHKADGTPATLLGTPAVLCYKNSTTESASTGITLTVDYDSRTGLNHIAIDTSANAAFFTTGSDFDIVITAGTVDSISVVGTVVATFSLENRSALRPATADRTLVVDSAGLADANAVKVGPTGAGTAQTARDIGATLGTAGAGLTALGDTRLAYLDAAVSSRSTYAGGAVASVTAPVALTSGERTAIANEVEAQIIDDTDSEKVLQAITDKIAATNPSLSGLTLAAIASAIRSNLATELGRMDAAVSSRLATAGYTAPSNPTDYARNNVAPSWWTAPNNAGIVTALDNLATLLGRTDPATALGLIQAVTDQLGDMIASGQFTEDALALAPASGGGGGSTVLYGDAGSVHYTFTSYDFDGITPLSGVAVYVSADEAGTQRSQTHITDSLGRVTFELDAGDAWFWCSRAGRDFDGNPFYKVVS